MKKAVRLLPLCVGLLAGPEGLALAADLPPAARETIDAYEKEVAEVQKDAEEQARKAAAKSVRELKVLQDRFAKEAKLDEAVAIRDQVRQLEGGPANANAADLPPAAREVVDAFNKEAAQIEKKARATLKKAGKKTADELKAIQDRFCKDGKLDEAVAVRDVRRLLLLGVPNPQPDPGYLHADAGDIGKVWYFEVVGNAGGATWGTDVYTTDSHLAASAVHAGVLGMGQKGVVKVTILPGQNNYPGTTRNGITSSSWAQWGVSFKVERVAGPVREGRPLKPGAANPQPDPGFLHADPDDIGKVWYFEVVGNALGATWGTDVYTSDSHLGATAVHAGVLGMGQKGVVKVTILPGQNNYPGTTRNGITSESWGQWDVSFKVERVRAAVGGARRK